MPEPTTTVQRTEDGLWVLNHGYYGLVDETVTGWAIERLEPNTEAAARELADRSADITALLERRMGDTVTKVHATTADFGRGGPFADLSLADMSRMIWGRAPGDEAKPRLRLTATKRDGRWIIGDFDYGAWEETL